MLVGIIEQRMVPFANWLTRSRHVLSLRDGFQLAMPFVIVGSLLVPILFPPSPPIPPMHSASGCTGWPMSCTLSCFPSIPTLLDWWH